MKRQGRVNSLFSLFFLYTWLPSSAFWFASGFTRGKAEQIMNNCHQVGLLMLPRLRLFPCCLEVLTSFHTISVIFPPYTLFVCLRGIRTCGCEFKQGAQVEKAQLLNNCELQAAGLIDAMTDGLLASRSWHKKAGMLQQ